MNKKSWIENIIESKEEYNFLKEPELKSRILLLTTGGSHAYGTNVEGSDVDLRGICIEDIKVMLGLSEFEQLEDKVTDTVIYGLKKYIGLAVNANPNVLELLGTPKDHLVICSDEGKILRDNINLFLSKKVIYSFGGYAFAQLRRLQNSLARDDEYPQSDKEKHTLNSINHAMHTFQTRYTEFTGANVNLYLDKSSKEEFDQEIFMDIDLKHYPIRDFASLYSDMSNIVKEYSKINHRNRKKDELHLLKHSMHLIRLLIMGAEILEGRSIQTNRPDREFLLSIRNGDWSYEQIFSLVDTFEKRFKYASENTNLPDAPDYKRIEEMMVEIYRSRYKLL